MRETNEADCRQCGNAKRFHNYPNPPSSGVCLDESRV
jgi:hypothetical protein